MHVGNLSQKERRERSRAALLESAARNLSRHGYARLNLELVAREAGYTRGALYHQFADKEALVIATLHWVDETWRREVSVDRAADPVTQLLDLARGHAAFCRRDIARFAMALRIEFSELDHPVGREVERVGETFVARCTKLIKAGRAQGLIPPGPPARTTARALFGALEGVVIGVADAELAARAVAGVLGVPVRR